MPEPADLDKTDHAERDAASIRILGFFFTVLGLLVLFGTLFALDNTRGAIVNAISGIVLATIGSVMLLLTRRGGKSKS
jgi:hypothetical protein